MINFDNTLFIIGIIILSVLLIIFVGKIVIDIYQHRFIANLKYYGMVVLAFAASVFMIWPMHQNVQKTTSYKATHAQIAKEYAPNSKTLTDETVSKTFTNNTQFDSKKDQENPVVNIVHTYADGDNTQNNVNRQVNLYLKSIKNIKDYDVTIKTQQPESHLLTADTPYSQTVTLIKK